MSTCSPKVVKNSCINGYSFLAKNGDCSLTIVNGAQEAAKSITPAYMSPSAVKSYLSCSLRFYFEKVLEITKPITPALHVGKVIHSALQSFNLARWHGNTCDKDTIKNAFDKAFNLESDSQSAVLYADDEIREKAKLCAWNTICHYMESDEVKPGMPKGVEVSLSVDVPGLDVPIHGIIDLIEPDMTVVDYKSAAAKPDVSNASFDHEIQLVSYQMLMEEATGELPTSLDLLYLVKTKQPQVIRVKAPLAGKQRKQRVMDMYKVAYEGIINENFYPQPGMQCSWCSYKKECLEWCK